MMNLEERVAFWRKWEERTRQLWCDLEDDKCGDFERFNAPDDIEQPIMEELFSMAVKMHILVSERLEIADKVYWAVDDKRDELRKKFNLDEETLPECEKIDYKTLQEAI